MTRFGSLVHMTRFGSSLVHMTRFGSLVHMTPSFDYFDTIWLSVKLLAYVIVLISIFSQENFGSLFFSFSERTG